MEMGLGANASLHYGSAMNDRSLLIDAFIARCGWEGASRAPLAGDASFRRYERVHLQGKRAVLMDAPPPQEDVRPFVRIARELGQYGLSAPRIMAADETQGFLLLEDLGDDLYSRVLRATPALEEELYLAAADVLAELYHVAPRADYSAVAPYDEALMMRECMLFAQWFLPAVMGAERAQPLAEEFAALWKGILAALPPAAKVLVLRDFHADNLLWLPQREGLGRTGLLDFQDAVIGSPAYDMVSFLEDARRDVLPSVAEKVIGRYLRVTAQDERAFRDSYAVLGAQRNCKIVGIFVRLAVRDKKPGYLSFLPRVWRHLEGDMAHPLLRPLNVWMDKHILAQWRGVIEVDKAA